MSALFSLLYYGPSIPEQYYFQQTLTVAKQTYFVLFMLQAFLQQSAPFTQNK